MKARTLFGLACLWGCLLLGVSCGNQSDYSLSYDVSFDEEHHYINVEMTLAGYPGEQVELTMPVWAPGYYLIVDFPKYLTDFEAFRPDGTPLAWNKQGKNVWQVAVADTVKARWRVFADERSVAESRVESGVAFVAPNGVFMYAGQEGVQHPVQLSFRLPEGWKNASTALPCCGCESSAEASDCETVPAASGCEPLGKCFTYRAADFDQLYDSPMLFGNHYVETFEQDGRSYEFALETPDGFAQSGMSEAIRKMIATTTGLMGQVPYDRYCFIWLGQGRGGLEHTASQACYTAGSFCFPNRASFVDELLFFTHEYFHLYNVKTIRPIELGPFDYSREVFTPMLWVSEGFTCYYETKICLAAGLITQEERLRELSNYIRDTESCDGHRHMSLRQSSYDIWLNFFNRAANGQDVRISYYVKGPVLGLLFDLELQQLTGGQRSLDDLMRLLYQRFYLELGRGFTEEEFWQAAGEVAGAPLDRLKAYVNTTEEIDYESILEPAGLALDRSTWTLSELPIPQQ